MNSDPSDDIRDAQGRELLDRDGRPLGRIQQIFLDEVTREPAWATVDAPGDAGRLVLVPLAHAGTEGERVRVTVTSEEVTSSPATTGESERFSPDHMDRVRRHYEDRSIEDEPAPSGATEPVGLPGTAVTDESPTATTDESPTVIRSEEELVIGRERVAHERVRLVKRIITETVTQTVEVRREELHVERVSVAGDTTDVAGDTADVAAEEPVARTVPAAGDEAGAGTGWRARTASLPLSAAVDSVVDRVRRRRIGGGEATFGDDFTEETVDITLMEEQVVVTKRVVPRERVRIRREVVVSQREVSDALRKERVEIEREPLDPTA